MGTTHVCLRSLAFCFGLLAECVGGDWWGSGGGDLVLAEKEAEGLTERHLGRTHIPAAQSQLEMSLFSNPLIHNTLVSVSNSTANPLTMFTGDSSRQGSKATNLRHWSLCPATGDPGVWVGTNTPPSAFATCGLWRTFGWGNPRFMRVDTAKWERESVEDLAFSGGAQQWVGDAGFPMHLLGDSSFVQASWWAAGELRLGRGSGGWGQGAGDVKKDEHVHIRALPYSVGQIGRDRRLQTCPTAQTNALHGPPGQAYAGAVRHCGIPANLAFQCLRRDLIELEI
ncbi:hypothetical protein BDK51DRAFT_27187 [Blyttiomyces helicus]|uniref:Uncharacterized protein n=1 Tax=Blyttiomyces helicus TaxID=388810 RepID=A0A4V1IRC4_9FUNG|nr:hypothetical protein BDK51DRAFT_27187 [Blyttiomyces helicus]|eukprot:RKO89567.1 hypothetical protein BDK51DRAFT_27187 [Blyttiomyces helicus]